MANEPSKKIHRSFKEFVLGYATATIPRPRVEKFPPPAAIEGLLTKNKSLARPKLADDDLVNAIPHAIRWESVERD